MNYYQLVPNDQIWNNWVLLIERINERLRIRERYRKPVCHECFQFDYDTVFREGFDPDIKIRARGDIVQTDDGLYCVRENLKQVFKRHRSRGLVFKRLGSSAWYVVNITLRVSGDKRVYKTDCIDGRRYCPACKRAVSVYGLFEFERQLAVPKQSRAFFTTVFKREGHHSAPDVFATEDIARLLQDAGIKGGMFRKLLNPKEEAQLEASIRRGKERWPPNTAIVL